MQLENVESFYPLTPLQQGLLFHTLADPNSRMYFNQTAVTLGGQLDLVAFRNAWQRVVDHHSVLRTFFVWEDVDVPIQVVEQTTELPFDSDDWRELTAPEQADRFEALRRDDLKRGFELSRAPLMRLTLIRTSDETWDLLWSFHHILLDGWSMFLVLRQVFSTYETLRKGGEAVLEPSRPYRDHLVWLRRQELAEAERFWRTKLAGFSRPTPLPAAQPIVAIADADETFATETVELSIESSRSLRSWAKQERLTPHTLLHGTWAVLLSRYAGESDVLHGVVVSGRPPSLEGVESMVGLFINTLPMRSRIDAHAPVGQWLRRLQSEQADMRQFEHCGLVDIQRWSELDGGTPLFESIFLFENYHKDLPLDAMATTLTIQNVRWFERFNYPLAALAIPGARTQLRLIYQRARFEQTAVSQLLASWHTLIEGLLTAPGQRVGELPVVDRQERKRLLVDMNDSARDYPRERTIHELFENQVERAPDAVALSYGEMRLSFRTLNEQSNQLAHRLKAMGVGAETRVGICMNRSPEMIWAVLGILKAGGAYTSLDPQYPRERLELMVASAGVDIVLTTKALASALPAVSELLCLDAEGESLARESNANPRPSGGPESLAYVSFTSGSTGAPKGVGVPHRSVVRLVKNTNFADLSSAQVFLQFAPLSFDASTLEIWGSLLNGARLVIAPPGSLALEQLGQVIRSQGVTTLWLTAGLFHQMIEDHIDGLQGVHQLLAGGDVLSAAHVRRALETLVGCTVVNGYGPTENTTFTCCHPMTHPEAVRDPVPIGRPIANTSVYVLDSYLQPVPVGAVGDIYAGGDGLARGYLSDPALTAERFIPHPFGDSPGARLYRIGDRGRYLPDGSIEFLGRKDYQVKVRGFRVELEEIESVLKQHPSVRDAVVTVRQDTSGEKRLSAYVVVDTAPPPTATTFREFLRRTLPAYMVPTTFLTVDAFPLTSNGKVDRRALPAPDVARHGLETDYVAPRAKLERRIAQIWADVLRVDHVGVEDNFFDLGGSSLDLMRVHSRLRATGAGEFPIVGLFEHPTVGALAKALGKTRHGRDRVVDLPDNEQTRHAGRDRIRQLRERRTNRDD